MRAQSGKSNFELALEDVIGIHDMDRKLTGFNY